MVQYLVGALAKKAIFCYNNKMIAKILSMFLLAVGLFSALAVGVVHAEEVQTVSEVKLIQSLSGGESISIEPGFRTLLNYFEDSRPWIFEVAVGFTVVWVLIGGIQFMTSGTDSSRRSTAVSRMTWAIVGLLILLFSGFILRTLNGMFFK